MDNNILKVLPLFCVIATIEAATLGQFCNGTITCDYTGGLCSASKCGCNAGYGEDNGECKSSLIIVSLTGPVSSVTYGSSTSLTATITTSIDVTVVLWQKVVSGGSLTTITIDSTKYIQTGDPGSGTVVLTINNLDYSDEGSYQVQVNNSLGETYTSNQKSVDVAGGELVITTDQNVTGRFGGNVTISCNVQGPELNKIQWKRLVSGVATDLTINGPKYSGGSLETPSLTIYNLNATDEGEYTCIASNPGGDYESPHTARVTLAYGEFNDNCDQAQLCDSSNHLTCSDGNLCVCQDTHYHKDGVCYLRSNLKPKISTVTNTASQFTLNWILSSEHNSLVTSFKVSWKVCGSSSLEKTTTVNKNVFTLTVSSELESGQLYTVTVTSVVELKNPAATINIESVGRNVRLDSLPPGPIKSNVSSFAHDNLNLKWIPPSNTFVTKYEVMIDNTVHLTTDSNPMLHFTMKSFTPGKYYVVSIVTISGVSDEKRSTAYNETIRITPTKPDPPINVRCPQNPKDISLEISWEPPTNPNGQIMMYQIHVNPGSPTVLIINTINNGTDYNVMGLTQDRMYNFTVRTINDATETQTVSDPSETISCSTTLGVSTPPTKIDISEIGSRGFKISFEKPVNVNGQLAGYKIVILKGSVCVREIFLEGNCPQCKDLVDCPNNQSIQKSDIDQPVVQQIINLKPYTHYLVKVAAVSGIGEGRFTNVSAMTEEEAPQKPRSLRATNIEAKTLTLSWYLAGPSPGNTTYTVEVHEGTDDTGTNFHLKHPNLYTYGFHQTSVSIVALEEYWPYKFKVIAATVKGTSESDFSDIIRTKQGAPGKVENLTVNLKEGNYRVAYTYWNIPYLRDRNGVLENYNFKVINQGVISLTYMII